MRTQDQERANKLSHTNQSTSHPASIPSSDQRIDFHHVKLGINSEHKHKHDQHAEAAAPLRRTLGVSWT